MNDIEPSFYINMYDIEPTLLKYHITIITDKSKINHSDVKKKYDELLSNEYLNDSLNIKSKDIDKFIISTSKGTHTS